MGGSGRERRRSRSIVGPAGGRKAGEAPDRREQDLRVGWSRQRARARNENDSGRRQRPSTAWRPTCGRGRKSRRHSKMGDWRGPRSSLFRGGSAPTFRSRARHPRRAALEEKTLLLYWRMAGQAFRRPRLLPHLVRAAWAFRDRRWYRRPPFLPLPARSYMRWRMETAYGDPDAVPGADELERYLVWASDMRRRMRRRLDD